MPAKLSIDGLTNGHVKQASALRDLLNHANRWHSWFCSRRAGKTSAAAFALVLYALAKPRRNCLYIGLTKAHAYDVIFREIVIPLLEAYGIAHTPNKQRQTVTFANGSTIGFTGSDDREHIRTFLGNRLALVVIDEQQDQKPKVLRSLVQKIIPPALSDSADGRILLCGTWPDVEAGFAYEEFKSGRYVTHTWAMADNPHLADPASEQRDYLARTGRTVDDPEYQRDWLGIPTWSNRKTAYRYDAAKNAWSGNIPTWAVDLELPPGKLLAVLPPQYVDTFAIGIDPAYTSDRYCIVVWGWSSVLPKGIWQVAEWTTDRAAHATKSQWLKALQLFVQHYHTVVKIISDSQATLDDVALIEYGLTIEPAQKGRGSVKQRVDRLSDLLATARGHVLAGSVLENDLKLAQFDQEKRAEGIYLWDDSIIHPDCADAATYALPAYIESSEPEKLTKTVEELAAERVHQSWHQQPVEYGYDANESDTGYGGPQD